VKGEQQLTIAVPPPRRRALRKRYDGPANPLFDALRELRRDLAAEAQLPPYVIFHDATLREMAAMRPTSRAEFGAISGVGARKLEAYGDSFLAVIRRHD